MVVIALAAPIRPGKHEAWRRFIQELQGLRHDQYQAARRRLGITKELAWLANTAQGEIIMLSLEAHDPALLLRTLVASQAAFDRWLKRQVFELHGLDLAQLASTHDCELLLSWQATKIEPV
jgi:hypothetical protein